MEVTSSKILDELKDDEKCVFCRQNFMDELLYGRVYQYEDVIAHYFCLLFSSQMEQNGRDDQGILGFLPRDVKKEINRANKIQCVYCHHDGATITCYVKSCKKKFHYPCGVENGSMHQFFEHFRSYCVSHRKTQYVPQQACKLTEKYLCLMCQEEVKPKPALFTIWAPCCQTAWFHRSCVQRMASSAGYFFKCPNCNNKDEFRKEMSECGIFIPDQDASWELEPNAYQELAERYNSCDAENCLCPNGRSYGQADCIWEIILCGLCGSQGIHSKCGNGQLDDRGQWTCSVCSTVSRKSPSFAYKPIEFEPSSSYTVISEPGRPRVVNRRGRPTARRRRNLPSSGSDSDSNLKKKKNDVSTLADSESGSSSRIFDQNGQEIEIVKCSAPSKNMVEIGGVNVNLNIGTVVDSDDNESDVEIDLRSTTRLERPPPIMTSTNGNSRSNALVCDTVIDLLESDDDSCHISPVAQSNYFANNNTTKHNDVTSSTSDPIIEVDNDDVIFVSSTPIVNDDLQIPSSTALLRFVENNRVYIVSPADVKRRGGLENLTSLLNPTNETGTSHPPRSSCSSTTVWQSVPLHKSIVHSLSTNQINPDYDSFVNGCSSLDKFIRKNDSDTQPRVSDNSVHDNARTKSWKPGSSEIIHID